MHLALTDWPDVIVQADSAACNNIVFAVVADVDRVLLQVDADEAVWSWIRGAEQLDHKGCWSTDHDVWATMTSIHDQVGKHVQDGVQDPVALDVDRPNRHVGNESGNVGG